MNMPQFQIRAFQPEDEAEVIALWRSSKLVVPQNDPHKDIQAKLKVQPDLFLVGLQERRIVATVMAGYEGHRGWINYLAVDPERRRLGLGRRMMSAAQIRLEEMGCPKINLQVRAGNREVIAFYEALGFKQDEVISLGKRL